VPVVFYPFIRPVAFHPGQRLKGFLFPCPPGASLRLFQNRICSGVLTDWLILW
jgi:hypothetical protein